MFDENLRIKKKYRFEEVSIERDEKEISGLNRLIEEYEASLNEAIGKIKILEKRCNSYEERFNQTN